MDYKNLIKKCAKRDNNARQKVYALFSAQMYSVCMRYAGNKADADDVFQQGFLNVFEDIGQVRNPDALPGWIKRVFVNTALRQLKIQRSVLVVYQDDFNSDGDQSLNDALIDMEVEKITELVNLLPSRCKEVFNMHVIDGFKHKEIAEMLGISIGSSKSYLHEAKQKLKIKMTNLNEIRLIKTV